MNNTEATPKASLSSRIDNFWYHYKWHTIVAVFIVFVLLICTLQMCGKTSYDTHVMYAGEKPIDNVSSDSIYHTMISAFKLVDEDHDEDGNVSPLFKNLLVPTTSQQLTELSDDGYDKLMNMNGDEFGDIMAYSTEYYLCFLSEGLFERYDKPTESGVYPFCDLAGYLPEGESAEFSSPRGIYLRSTDFYDLPGIKELPDDTVICLRAKLKLPGANRSDEYFDRAVAMLKKVLAYSASE